MLSAQTSDSVDLSKISDDYSRPMLDAQLVFLSLLTGAMAKSSVADYDAKGTAGKNRVKKLMDMAKTIAEVYNA